ncbi:RND family efflux transporter MFP subunit [Hyphomonas adhaerens MHS-3]|uniref:RND family efflux transporter MFP subunit n=1 Tax=Hyphomonas adhaerens MHS-3 TaxID=1280949 RepID=A0A069E050_9PROT|nr:efflux RND transporter periplasmic adaptor subunit [Hyphomonas adhaerens]KCZ82591.1 RND family efflux transporter MFP subunit [Hyphomonas adhaerens MHS-3]
MARKKSSSRWGLLAFVAAAAAIGVYVFVSASSNGEEQTLQTEKVTRGDIEVTISAAGKIAPKEEVAVGAQVSGQLETLYVDVGDTVEAGDLLAQIDATIATTSVEANRAQLKELRASRKQQQATLELVKSQSERATMLYEADAMAKADYEAAIADYQIAQGRLEAIDAQIERQSSSLQADLASLAFTKIYAPISGTVVSLEAVEGQTLNANQTAPTILTIADLTTMTVETDVSEADVLRITKDQPAWFTTLGDSEYRWETKVRQVLPTPEVLNDVVLYKALLDVDNPEGRLRTEMTAQVFFVLGSAKDAILVPITALQSAPARRAGSDADATAGPAPMPAAFKAALEANPDADKALVMVLGSDGNAQPRPILTGLRTRTQAEVIYGLEPGDTVVSGNVFPKQVTSNQTRRMGPPPMMGR